MGKNIVVITGSPRKAGNTTALTAEFIRGTEESITIICTQKPDGGTNLATVSW